MTIKGWVLLTKDGKLATDRFLQERCAAKKLVLPGEHVSPAVLTIPEPKRKAKAKR